MKLKIMSLMIIILIFFVVGCSQTQVQQQESAPLKIGILAYPGFAPFYIADEKGFFEKHGVDVEVVTFVDVPNAISALASNKVQLLFSSADFTTILSDSGINVKEIFASDIGYGSDGLVVTEDINSLSELKGKKVHLDMGTPSHFLLAYLAKQENVDLNEDMELVQMNADQVGAAFVAGQLDYGLTWEPWLSNAVERSDGKVLFTSKDKPGIITDTIVVRTEILNSQRENIKSIMKAWFDSVDYWRNNKNEGNSIMAKELGLPAEDFEAMVETIKFLTPQENLEKFSRSGELNIFKLTSQASTIYIDAGIIQSEVSAEIVVDSSLLTELYG